MKKTGSELTSEIVGPAGSTKKVGAFSCWIVEEDEDELWREPEELLGADWVRPGFGKSATPRQIRSAAGTEFERRNGNCISETCLQVYLDALAGSNGSRIMPPWILAG
jgi:hypothetical protein